MLGTSWCSQSISTSLPRRSTPGLRSLSRSALLNAHPALAAGWAVSRLSAAAAPLRAIFARGIDQGVLRDDLPSEVLFELFGGVLATAVKLVGERRLGLEETAAATTTLFLDGARPPQPSRVGTDGQS